MNRLTVLLVLVSILTGSCQSDDEATINNSADAIILSSPPTAESDPFALESARAEGTTVTAVVRYGGGCEDHQFRVYWDGIATKSIPPQMVVNVYHDDQGDTCEAYLIDMVSFDAQELLGDLWNLDEEAVLIIRNANDGETISVTVGGN